MTHIVKIVGAVALGDVFLALKCSTQWSVRQMLGIQNLGQKKPVFIGLKRDPWQFKQCHGRVA
jgi:hypothetical protein